MTSMIAPTSEHTFSSQEDAPQPAYRTPALDDLTPAVRARLVRFIITSTLERGVAPTAVIALYADVSDDPVGVLYADQRFTLRQIPEDWRNLEDEVMDLEGAAHERGIDLAAEWRRAHDVAVPPQEPLDQLVRLAGTGRRPSSSTRSIFDDPEDLDALAALDDPAAAYAPLDTRLPDLVDLAPASQDRIRRFAIEETLEHGLPPFETLELYRAFENEGDERSRQYLDRVFVDNAAPADWRSVQANAREVVDLASIRGEDAGRLFADILRASPNLAPATALRLLVERLTASLR